MRVISGKAKGRKLKLVPGDTTRPIMDRVKESLFNILGAFVPGTRWLDLFAGTGQVGIEALSRGAAECVFVDNARAAVRTIQGNLRHTGLTDGAEVRLTNAFAYLELIRRNVIPRFDLIYIAPPQYKGVWVEILQQIDVEPAAFVNEGGLVVVQIDPKEYSSEKWQNLVLGDERRYGRTLLLFYESPAVETD